MGTVRGREHELLYRSLTAQQPTPDHNNRQFTGGEHAGVDPRTLMAPLLRNATAIAAENGAVAAEEGGPGGVQGGEL